MVKEMAVNERDRLNSYTLELSEMRCVLRKTRNVSREMRLVNEMRGGTELTLEWYCYWYLLKSNLKLLASPKDEISKRYEFYFYLSSTWKSSTLSQSTKWSSSKPRWKCCSIHRGLVGSRGQSLWCLQRWGLGRVTMALLKLLLIVLKSVWKMIQYFCSPCEPSSPIIEK